MSDIFIETDSLQHLKISRQTYPKNLSKNVSLFSRDANFPKIMRTIHTTGGPSSLHERGRDSCLPAVLCYKRLFTKVCMGCKRFFLKERKNDFF